MGDKGERNLRFKILFLGDSRVGKTCFIQRYTDKTFQEECISTIGTNSALKQVSLQEKTIILTLNDTAGQERYKCIGKSMYQNTDAIVLIYDVTERESFASISKWLSSIREATNENELVIALIGNKIDKEGRQVEIEEGQKQALDLKALFSETSVKTNENVEAIMEKLVEELVEKKKIKSEQKIILTDGKEKEKKEQKKKKKKCYLSKEY